MKKLIFITLSIIFAYLFYCTLNSTFHVLTHPKNAKFYTFKDMNGKNHLNDKDLLNENKHIYTMQLLQTDYDLAKGAINKHVASLQKIDSKYRYELALIEQNTNTKLRNINEGYKGACIFLWILTLIFGILMYLGSKKLLK